MTNVLNHYRLHITPLSPIHIGTGDSYDPTQYVIEDGVLYEFDTGAALQALTAADRAELLKITSGKPTPQMLKGVQAFFYQRRDQLKPWAVQQIPVLEGVADLYRDRIGQTAQREGQGREVLNKLEIDRYARNPVSREPVLLGSSLKGAIRTALLNQVNNKQSARERQGLHEFQGRLLQYRDPERGRLHLELDPLRLVQIADAAWQGQGLPGAEIHFAVNRKKQPVVDAQGRLRKAMGESENLNQILECVPPWRYRAFTGQLTLQDVSGLSVSDHRGERRLPDPRFTLKDIAHACNAFYLPNLTRERKILKERGFVDSTWDAAITQTLQRVKDKITANQAFLLRVGRHSGAEAVTLEGVRKIRIMQGHGQPAGQADTAKTLWLAANDKNQTAGLLPFGWLLVEVEPLDAPVNDWPELKQLCEPHLKTAQHFAEQQAKQQETLAKARVEAEQRRREEAEQARVKAEAEAEQTRRAAEQAECLARMSENARRAIKLREQLTPASRNKGKGHGLFNTLKNMITEAENWTTEDRAELQRVVVDGFEHLGIKKDEYKKLIRDLNP